MGQKLYGVVTGSGANGGEFYSQAFLDNLPAQIVSLKSVQTAAIALESAVSTSLIGSGTAGATAAVGWMSGTKLATLSASYSSVTGTIF